MNYWSGHAAVLVTCGNHKWTSCHFAVKETFKSGGWFLFWKLMMISRCEQTCNSRTCCSGSLSQRDSKAEGVIRGPSWGTSWVLYLCVCVCRSYLSIKMCWELFTWACWLVCDLELVCIPGSAHRSAPCLELCLNPEECGKANGEEREHESPNCPVDGVAERLHSQTVKRICVATLVRGPRCDVGSPTAGTSGAAVRYSISPTCCWQHQPLYRVFTVGVRWSHSRFKMILIP